MSVPHTITVRQELTSDDNQRNCDDCRYRKETLATAKRLNKITVIGAIVSLLGIVAIFKTITVSKVAADAAVSQSQTAREEFENSQRPWIALRISNAQLIFDDNDVRIDPAIANLHNFGQSVARNVAFIPYLVTNEEDDGHQCDRMITQPRPANPNASPYPYGQILFPTEVENEAMATFKKGQFTDLQMQSMRLIACAIYSSPIDNIPHHTRVVYKLDLTEPSNPRIIGKIYHLSLVMDSSGTRVD